MQDPSADAPNADGVPSSTTRPRADLSRLRIPRDGPARASRGFPWLRVLAIVAVGALAFLFKDTVLGWFGGNGATVRTAKALRVVPGQATAGDVSANGYIVADTQASLASVLSGRLVELHAAEGDIVEKDAVVARIQFDDYEVEYERTLAAVKAADARLGEARSRTATALARVGEARSDVAAARLTSVRLEAEVTAQRELESQAKENLDRLEREVERNRALHQQKLINHAEWDRIETAARTAKLDLLSAKARTEALDAADNAWDGQIKKREASLAVAVSNEAGSRSGEIVAAAGLAEAKQSQAFAAIQLDKTKIRAPFRGLVIRKDAEKGEVIAPTGAGNSRGSVLTIVDPESLEVQVELSERRLARGGEGDQASVFLNAMPDQRLAGVVRKIWPRAERSKGTIEVRVRLEKRPSFLRPDMAARVVFKGKEEGATGPQPAEPFVSVPRGAVVQRGGRSVVFVVQAGTARIVPIALRESAGTSAEVTEGLAGGETVVLDPDAGLEDGDAVKTE